MREHRQEAYGSVDDTFGVEVRTSYDTFDPEPDRYEITLWRGKHNKTGSTLGVSIGDWAKACAIGKYLYETLAPEHVEAERLSNARWEVTSARMAVESEERKARAKVERAERRAKAKQATVKVERAVCPDCGHDDMPDAFEQEVRECSRCGQTLIGEDARHCPECHIFTARVGDIACPSCEQALDADPEIVIGVEVDGVFVADSEITDEEES